MLRVSTTTLVALAVFAVLMTSSPALAHGSGEGHNLRHRLHHMQPKMDNANCVVTMHIHLALASQRDISKRYFNVMWKTNTSTPDAYAPFVKFGYSETEITGKAHGTSCQTRTYTGVDWHHDCTFGPIAFGKPVYYYVGNDNCPEAVMTVLTAHALTAHGADASVAIIGDLGLENALPTVQTVGQALAQNKVDLMFHIGDISYADDFEPPGPNPDYEPKTDEFMSLIEPLTTRAGYMVTPGNHDVTCSYKSDEGCPEYLRNFTAFRTRWRMPGHESFGVDNMWYSFNHGNIHFVSINTETDHEGSPFKPSGNGTIHAGGFGKQMQWLELDLASANLKENRSVRPWIVVLGHRPLYSTSNLDYPPGQQGRTRAAFEPLLLKYKVDVYMSGHVHWFERTWPMNNQVVTAKSFTKPLSPVYVINGAGGNQEGHPDHYTPEVPEYTVFRDTAHFGFSLVKTKTDAATGTLSLCHDFIGAGVSVDEPIDSFCITK